MNQPKNMLFKNSSNKVTLFHPALRVKLARSEKSEKDGAGALSFSFARPFQAEGIMNHKEEQKNNADYRIGTTKYTVTPVFREHSEKENIEDKVKRLILQDKKTGA